MEQLKVSICCITYNHEKYIERAIESFLSQECNFSYEILIHDDASTDRTADIIRAYEKKYPGKIKPIYQTKNQYRQGVTNPSGVFNFPRAKGIYIAMCEGDDFWNDKKKLAKQVAIMDRNPTISFCFHAAKILNMDSTFADRLVRPYTYSGRISQREVIDKKSGYPTASLLFRKKYIENMPEFYFDAPIGDIPLQLILAYRGEAYYSDEAMSVYRIGDASSWTREQSGGDYIKKQETYYQQIEKMYDAFDLYSQGIFHEVVENAKLRIRFHTYMNTKSFKDIYNPIYKTYYKELNIKTRFLTSLEYHCPILYRCLKHIYIRVRR